MVGVLDIVMEKLHLVVETKYTKGGTAPQSDVKCYRWAKYGSIGPNYNS